MPHLNFFSPKEKDQVKDITYSFLEGFLEKNNSALIIGKVVAVFNWYTSNSIIQSDFQAPESVYSKSAENKKMF